MDRWTTGIAAMVSLDLANMQPICHYAMVPNHFHWLPKEKVWATLPICNQFANMQLYHMLSINYLACMLV
jgi:hypothetical protein